MNKESMPYCFEDNYEHPCENVVYIEENIPGPTTHEDPDTLAIADRYNSQISAHCDCRLSCTATDKCPCVTEYKGDNYIMNSANIYEATIHESKLNGPIFECNSLCHCNNQMCGNRLVQYGPRKNLLLISTGSKGLGVSTETFIRKGSFICEYAGEVISKAEALLRHKYNENHNKMNYIFCLNEYTEGKCTQSFVDPSKLGNIGRYINHSCEPNCCIVPVRVDSLLPKLAIFSVIDITPHSEITFDYGPSEAVGVGGVEAVDDGGAAVRTPCWCGASSCRRWLPNAPELECSGQNVTP